MKLIDYKQEIRGVVQEPAKINRPTWDLPAYDEKFLDYRSLKEEIFGTKDVLYLSREDLYDAAFQSAGLFIMKVIYWGYPNPYPYYVKHFDKVLRNFELLTDIITNLQKNKEQKDFQAISKKFENVGGIGLSTYSKFLCFLRVRFRGKAALILDSKITKVVEKAGFDEFENIKG